MSVHVKRAAWRKSRCARFVLGRDCAGRWILRDAEGLGYAIFASADAAIRYAHEESGGDGDAIVGYADIAPHRGRTRR